MSTTAKVQKKSEHYPQKQESVLERVEEVFRQMFENTCQVLEQIDGKKFIEQAWSRDQNGKLIASKKNDDTIYVDQALHDGKVFEKVGVNYVATKCVMPSGMNFQKSGALATAAADLINSAQNIPYAATGISFVIHPDNPMIPTAHVNYRYFQVGDYERPNYWWFGGGADLTPAYLFEEDAVYFHQVHKNVCDKHDPSYYSRFKKGCDEYFYIPHRSENRGIGGIFFDQLNEGSADKLLSFVTDCTKAFSSSYIPIVQRRKCMRFTEENKHWQHLVRGRYAEFILTSDRGLRFGLESGMVSTQSVFNCMPPAVCWRYDDQPFPGSKEAKLREVLKNPRNWI